MIQWPFAIALQRKNFITFQIIVNIHGGGLYPKKFEEGVDDFYIYKNNQKYGKLYKYYKIFGKNLTAMHHYCYGLKIIKELPGKCNDQKCRNYELNLIISEFDYVLKHSDSKFIMRPELLMSKGNILLLLNKLGEAARSYQEAIKIKPNFVPAYIGLSRVYILVGDKKVAIKILQKGLKNVPDDKILKTELLKLTK